MFKYSRSLFTPRDRFPQNFSEKLSREFAVHPRQLDVPAKIHLATEINFHACNRPADRISARAKSSRDILAPPQEAQGRSSTDNATKTGAGTSRTSVARSIARLMRPLKGDEVYFICALMGSHGAMGYSGMFAHLRGEGWIEDDRCIGAKSGWSKFSRCLMQNREKSLVRANRKIRAVGIFQDSYCARVIKKFACLSEIDISIAVN